MQLSEFCWRINKENYGTIALHVAHLHIGMNCKLEMNFPVSVLTEKVATTTCWWSFVQKTRKNHHDQSHHDHLETTLLTKEHPVFCPNDSKDHHKSSWTFFSPTSSLFYALIIHDVFPVCGSQLLSKATNVSMCSHTIFSAEWCLS